MKCRQIGASHTYAGAAVLWGMFGEDTSIISIGERESSDVLKKVAKHADALTRLGSEWARVKAVSSTRITLRSGATITALPSTSGGRGAAGNVLLDEAAYYEHADEVWDAASATVFHGYKLRVMSTPNGVGGLFYELVTDPARSKGYTMHRVSLADARADGLKADDAQLWAAVRGDERLFNQQYMCSFLDGEEQYIPTSLIDACTIDSTELMVPAPCFAGYDVGLVNDLGALVALQQTSDRRVWVKTPVTCKRTDWEGQQRIIAQAFSDWNINRLCIDSTGLGSVPAEMLQKLLGKHRVEPVVFTMQSKEVLATGLYQAFADGMIRIPRDEALRRDICSLRRVITAAGNVRYDAPRTGEGHADRAWALALAIHACSIKPASRVESGSGDYENP